MSSDEDHFEIMEKRRVYLSLAMFFALIGVVFSFWLLFKHPELGRTPIFTLLGAWLPYYALLAFVWKCSKCGSRIGNQPMAKHCPKCGEALKRPD